MGLLALSGAIPTILFEEEKDGASVGYGILDEKYSLKEKGIKLDALKEKLQNACKEKFEKNN